MNIFLLWKVVRIGVTWCYLAVGWLLFTWSLEPFSLFLGSVFSLFIALETYDLFIGVQEGGVRALIPRLDLAVFFLAVLIVKIYIASFRMVKLLFSMNMNPRIVHFRTRLMSDNARALLANSITLTPGTLTIDLDDDHLLVHWVHATTTHGRKAGEIIKGQFENWLGRIWM